MPFLLEHSNGSSMYPGAWAVGAASGSTAICEDLAALVNDIFEAPNGPCLDVVPFHWRQSRAQPVGQDPPCPKALLATSSFDGRFDQVVAILHKRIINGSVAFAKP